MRGLTEVEAWILAAPQGECFPDGLRPTVDRLVTEGRLKILGYKTDGRQIITVVDETAEGREALRLHRIIKAMGIVFA